MLVGRTAWPWSPKWDVVLVDLRARSSTKTERASEAKLIDAKARAEVAALEARAQVAALEARLAADEKQVKLLADNPLLVRVKELDVLRDIGLEGGNHFYIGLEKLTRPPGAG